jgi:arabinan endo-1,5-alpha-L-arabinosidase
MGHTHIASCVDFDGTRGAVSFALSVTAVGSGRFAVGERVLVGAKVHAGYSLSGIHYWDTCVAPGLEAYRGKTVSWDGQGRGRPIDAGAADWAHIVARFTTPENGPVGLRIGKDKTVDIVFEKDSLLVDGLAFDMPVARDGREQVWQILLDRPYMGYMTLVTGEPDAAGGATAPRTRVMLPVQVDVPARVTPIGKASAFSRIDLHALKPIAWRGPFRCITGPRIAGSGGWSTTAICFPASTTTARRRCDAGTGSSRTGRRGGACGSQYGQLAGRYPIMGPAAHGEGTSMNTHLWRACLMLTMMQTAMIAGAEDAARAASDGHAAAAPDAFPLRLPDMRVRDPFIVADPDSRTYYLYAQGGNRPNNDNADLGVEAYRSRDLVHWSEPIRVFERPKTGFWGTPPIWAPEVHKLDGAYYLFATLRGRAGGMGTQIMRSEHPGGPFVVLGDGANTPPDQRALDATPWIDADGRRWMIYCHEWTQIQDGAMRAVRMTDDWSARLGEPVLLFHASEAPWVRPYRHANEFVTDGPFLHRTKSGALLMLWSSFIKGGGYALGQAVSESGTVAGPWRHEAGVLYGADGQDGGHGMILRDFSGDLLLVFHQPNGGGRERTQIHRLKEENDRLKLDGIWTPPPAAANTK